MKNTIIVNLYGGPGTGKSTGAAYIFSKLKMQGIDAEYVTEFAKDKVWEGSPEAFKCQFYISGKQAFRVSRCFGKVDIIVTDSPIRLGKVYTDRPALQAACTEEANRYRNCSLDIFLRRTKSYNPNGRNQTEEESNNLDQRIRDMLIADAVEYIVADGSIEGYDQVFDIVMDKFSSMRQFN